MKPVHGHLLMKWYYKSAFVGMAQNQTQTQKKSFKFYSIFIIVDFHSQWKDEYIIFSYDYK